MSFENTSKTRIDNRNPFSRLHDMVALSSKDWSMTDMDRMIYAIVCGWSGDNDEWSYEICCKEFGWSKEEADFFKMMHEKFAELEKMEYPAN